MRKRIIAFYDVLLFAIICSPMIVTAVILLFMLVTKGTSEWVYENWYVVLIFAITFMVPIGGTLMFRYCVINNDSIHFHYFPFTKSWKNATNNIDIRWNQDVVISEIKDIEIAKLTEEEKQIITNISNKYGMNVDLSNIKTYDAIGCKHCNNTGYYDRIGVFEVLDLDDEIKELIVKGASSIEIRNKALEKNYRPLAVDGIKKVLMGITTLEELNNKLLIF